MKIRTVLSLFCVVGFVGWCLWSCDPPRSYSVIPEIHFKSLVFEDRIDDPELQNPVKYAILTFSFIDGNGDIGRSPQDIERVSRIHYIWYQKRLDNHPDSTYVSHMLPDSTIIQSSEIPYEEVMNKEEAHNKTLKGTIEIAFSTPINIQNVDTMRIEFYIADRERNRSNVEYTPDFSIQNPPTEPIKK